MVYGVVVTEYVRSRAQDICIEDPIQETTALTGAISAQYGRLTGGVVNSITKSAGNRSANFVPFNPFTGEKGRMPAVANYQLSSNSVVLWRSTVAYVPVLGRRAFLTGE